MAIHAKLKRWGNSIGIVIPSEVLRKKNLREGEEIIIEIEQKKPIAELFGSLKKKKLDSQKIKDEIRAQEND